METLLGVVPSCDRYLEIWRPALRTYDVMVPNFLHLPPPVFGVGTPGVDRGRLRSRARANVDNS